ncbi:MAG: 50S ribosomal protein L21 [Pelagibacterales bacterium]|nr:50S ribosomal protein L21 [Pelagibacterales bacterium]PPR16911.1 MAG: 50S ribosomal protein L21 [Alphaproteobacteria bacterium MarineAlpha9_Bin3]|tara:strand:- start:1016 stop:1471 length:456 start_codon:yes stop_codon:yes gene_type:complete
MNYAVLKSGGKQYKVSAGDVILVEKIIGESGSKVKFDNIIMMGEGAKIHVEESELKNATVTGEVIEQTRGPKLLVFKKKRRHNYRRKKGHKQDLTAIRIESIDLKKIADKTLSKDKTKKSTEVKTAKKTEAVKKTTTRKKDVAKKPTAKKK